MGCFHQTFPSQAQVAMEEGEVERLFKKKKKSTESIETVFCSEQLLLGKEAYLGVGITSGIPLEKTNFPPLLSISCS